MPAETLTRPRESTDFKVNPFPLLPSYEAPPVRSLPKVEPGRRSHIYRVDEDTEFIPMSGGWGFYRFNEEKLIQDLYFVEPLYDVPEVLVFPQTVARKGEYVAWSALPDFGNVQINYKSAQLPLKEVSLSEIKIPSLLEFMLNDFRGIEDYMNTSDPVLKHNKRRIPTFAFDTPHKQHAA